VDLALLLIDQSSRFANEHQVGLLVRLCSLNRIKARGDRDKCYMSLLGCRCSPNIYNSSHHATTLPYVGNRTSATADTEF